MVSANLTSWTKKFLQGVAHRQETLSSHYLVAGELFLEAHDLAAEFLHPGSNSLQPLEDVADGGLNMARPGSNVLLYFESRKRRKRRSLVGHDWIVLFVELLSYFVYIKVGAHAEWAQGNTRNQSTTHMPQLARFSHHAATPPLCESEQTSAAPVGYVPTPHFMTVHWWTHFSNVRQPRVLLEGHRGIRALAVFHYTAQHPNAWQCRVLSTQTPRESTWAADHTMHM